MSAFPQAEDVWCISYKSTFAPIESNPRRGKIKTKKPLLPQSVLSSKPFDLDPENTSTTEYLTRLSEQMGKCCIPALEEEYMYTMGDNLSVTQEAKLRNLIDLMPRKKGAFYKQIITGITNMGDQLLQITFNYLDYSDFITFSKVSRYSYAICFAHLYVKYIHFYLRFPPWWVMSINRFSLLLTNSHKLHFLLRYFIPNLILGYEEWIINMERRGKEIITDMVNYINEQLIRLHRPIINLHSATKFISKQLLSARMNNKKANMRPIVIAVQENHIEIFKYLILKGTTLKAHHTNIKGLNCLEMAIFNKSGGLVKLILEHIKTKKQLFSDYNKNNLFLLTIKHSTNYILTLLIDYVKQMKTGVPTKMTEDIQMSIGYSIKNKKNDCLDILMKMGYDSNKCIYEDKTGLMLACKYKNTEAGEEILKQGSGERRHPKLDINISNSKQRTAYYYAAKYAPIILVEKIIDLKPDPNKVCLENKSPLFVGIERKHLEILKLLLEYSTFKIFKCLTTYGVSLPQIATWKLLQHDDSINTAIRYQFEALHNQILELKFKYDMKSYVNKRNKKSKLKGETPIATELLEMQYKLKPKKYVIKYRYNFAQLKLNSKVTRRHSVDLLPKRNIIKGEQLIEKWMYKVNRKSKLLPSFNDFYNQPMCLSNITLDNFLDLNTDKQFGLIKWNFVENQRRHIRVTQENKGLSPEELKRIQREKLQMDPFKLEAAHKDAINKTRIFSHSVKSVDNSEFSLKIKSKEERRQIVLDKRGLSKTDQQLCNFDEKVEFFEELAEEIIRLPFKDNKERHDIQTTLSKIDSSLKIFRHIIDLKKKDPVAGNYFIPYIMPYLEPLFDASQYPVRGSTTRWFNISPQSTPVQNMQYTSGTASNNQSPTAKQAPVQITGDEYNRLCRRTTLNHSLSTETIFETLNRRQLKSGRSTGEGSIAASDNIQRNKRKKYMKMQTLKITTTSPSEFQGSSPPGEECKMPLSGRTNKDQLSAPFYSSSNSRSLSPRPRSRKPAQSGFGNIRKSVSPVGKNRKILKRGESVESGTLRSLIERKYQASEHRIPEETEEQEGEVFLRPIHKPHYSFAGQDENRASLINEEEEEGTPDEDEVIDTPLIQIVGEDELERGITEPLPSFHFGVDSGVSTPEIEGNMSPRGMSPKYDGIEGESEEQMGNSDVFEDISTPKATMENSSGLNLQDTNSIQTSMSGLDTQRSELRIEIFEKDREAREISSAELKYSPRKHIPLASRSNSEDMRSIVLEQTSESKLVQTPVIHKFTVEADRDNRDRDNRENRDRDRDNRENRDRDNGPIPLDSEWKQEEESPSETMANLTPIPNVGPLITDNTLQITHITQTNIKRELEDVSIPPIPKNSSKKVIPQTLTLGQIAPIPTSHLIPQNTPNGVLIPPEQEVIFIPSNKSMPHSPTYSSGTPSRNVMRENYERYANHLASQTFDDPKSPPYFLKEIHKSEGKEWRSGEVLDKEYLAVIEKRAKSNDLYRDYSRNSSRHSKHHSLDAGSRLSGMIDIINDNIHQSTKNQRIIKKQSNNTLFLRDWMNPKYDIVKPQRKLPQKNELVKGELGKATKELVNAFNSPIIKHEIKTPAFHLPKHIIFNHKSGEFEGSTRLAYNIYKLLDETKRNQERQIIVDVKDEGKNKDEEKTIPSVPTSTKKESFSGLNIRASSQSTITMKIRPVNPFVGKQRERVEQKEKISPREKIARKRDSIVIGKGGRKCTARIHGQTKERDPHKEEQTLEISKQMGNINNPIQQSLYFNLRESYKSMKKQSIGASSETAFRGNMNNSRKNMEVNNIGDLIGGFIRNKRKAKKVEELRNDVSGGVCGVCGGVSGTSGVCGLCEQRMSGSDMYIYTPEDINTKPKSPGKMESKIYKGYTRQMFKSKGSLGKEPSASPSIPSTISNMVKSIHPPNPQHFSFPQIYKGRGNKKAIFSDKLVSSLQKLNCPLGKPYLNSLNRKEDMKGGVSYDIYKTFTPMYLGSTTNSMIQIISDYKNPLSTRKAKQLLVGSTHNYKNTHRLPNLQLQKPGSPI